MDDTTMEGPAPASVRFGGAVPSRRLLDAMDRVNVVARAMGRFFADDDDLLTPDAGAPIVMQRVGRFGVQRTSSCGCRQHGGGPAVGWSDPPIHPCGY